MLAKVSKDHHYYESSAKEGVPRFCATLGLQFMYYVQIVSRCFVTALLMAYLRFWALIPLIVFLLVNGLMTKILRTDHSKNVWTTFSSIITPVGFMSKDDVNELTNPSRRFHYFYKSNAVLFAVISIASMIALDFGLAYDWPGYDYKCHYIPILSCRKETDEICDRIPICPQDQDQHYGFQLYGNIVIVVLNVFQVIGAFLQQYCVLSETRALTPI